MKHLFILLTLISVWMTASVQASTWKIDDEYIGGDYFESKYVKKDGDVIAITASEFDIQWMKVSIKTSGDVTVRIKTKYQDGTRDTTYGDLFVSTDGWSPHGEIGSGYRTDKYGTGESWEYALSTTSGNIYSVDPANIWLSNQEFADPHYHDDWYRHFQEVLYKPESEEAPAGTFAFSHAGNLISYAFNLSDFGLTWEDELNLGFHWAMTCANDVIEGGIHKAAVPEPGTMLLLGMGIAGLGAAGRKKVVQQQKEADIRQTFTTV